MNPDMIPMSPTELHRLPVLEAVVARQITQTEAATCLRLSTRQIRRLQQRVATAGPAGLAHRNRGRPSNRRCSEALRHRVLTLLRARYEDFGPTLAVEQLAAHHQIALSRETLRRWMRAAGLLSGRRRPRPHRQWRERRACAGQMVQMDGSHHAWLEARGPTLVLMGYVDDATGTVYARLYPAEDLPAVLDSFRRYCQRYGVPQSVYCDRYTLYKSPGKPTLEDQLANRRPQSQFERACAELGVTVIHAYSPQAKGRVERLFKTLQDRLVKTLRLAHARTVAEANTALHTFLPAYNRRFARPARQPGDLHRRVPSPVLAQVLCRKESRVVANDGTIAFDGQHLQLRPSGRRPVAQRGVTVTVSPTAQIRVRYAGQDVPYRVLPPAARRAVGPASLRVRRPTAHPAAPEHPWKRTWSRRRLRDRTLLLC